MSDSKTNISQHIKDQSEKIFEELVEIRRDFHAHPELRFEEVRTAKICEEFVKNLGMDTKTNVGKTGVVGLLNGGRGNGKVLGIRCDMDALPILEKSNAPYCSQNDGVMHACGHDVHVTVALGVAKILAGMSDDMKGAVKFIFQPSEENPFGEKSGSLSMIEDGVLENPHVDAILSLHCWPQLDAGQVGVGPGPAMAAVAAFEIILDGISAHVATPHKGRDTMLGAAQIINSLYQITSRRTDPADSIALTINGIQGGSIQPVVGGSVRMSGDVRTLSKELMDYIMGLIKNTVDGVSGILELESTFTIDDYYPPVFNDANLDAIISDSASRIIGSENTILQENCPMTAEDFSHFTDKIPGHYMKLGISNDEKGIRFALHNDSFDVDERCMAAGVSVLADAALNFLS